MILEARRKVKIKSRISEKPIDTTQKDIVSVKKTKPTALKKHRIDKEVVDKQVKEWVNNKLKADYPVKERYSIWDAMVAWRDHILSSSFLKITKKDYLSRMQKLIDESVINPSIKLICVNEIWLHKCSKKIAESCLSEKTKTSRKTCLLSFYKFAQKFDPDYSNEYKMLSYRHIPTPDEIKNRFVLSSAREPLLNNSLDIQKLYRTIKKHNERDAWIIALMLETGCSLEEVVKITKNDISQTYVCINHFQYPVPLSLVDGIKTLFKEDSSFVFSTKKGEKVGRVQVTRNLKKSGREIGLRFDLTPMVFHRFINDILLRDKRSPWEKFMC